MNIRSTGIAVAFLFGTAAVVYGQQDSTAAKNEKRIEGVQIRAAAKKNTENSIINVQKRSVEVIERVGAVQLSKQGVSDVATAVTKATGTVKQEGSSTISVRGLLDRYNTTSMNGLPIPADDPENKNIDLGLFKTDMIEFIDLEKVYQPRLLGDFGGANINIASREHAGKPFFSIELGSGINSQIIDLGNKPFYMAQGPTWTGFKSNKLPDNPLKSYNYASWNFKDGFGPRNFTPLNTEFNLSGGRTFKIGETGRLNTFIFAGFDNSYKYKEGREGFFGKETIFNDYNDSKKYSYGTNTTALLNFIYRLNAEHTLKLFSNYIHGSEQETRIHKGYVRDVAEDYNGLLRRSDFKHTHLFVNQLGGDHRLNDKFTINWIAGYNYLNSERPDRISNFLFFNEYEGKYELRRDGGATNRYWDELNDKEWAGNIAFTYQFNDNGKFTLGYQGRGKNRDFESRQVDFKWDTRKSGTRALVDDVNDIDFIYNQQNYTKGFFGISSNYGVDNLKPIRFDGTQDVHSGFANAEYRLGENFTGQLGVRYENIKQDIDWDTNFETGIPGSAVKFTYDKWLPALNLKYALNDKNTLRFAASRTYTLPQLKEMAPFIYNDVSDETVGNPLLYPSDNNNIDIKWEMFPKSGEVISITAFGKFIENPIARSLINSSAFYYSYLNVGDKARVLGVEAEIRKDIAKFDRSRIYGFANATYMDSESDLDIEKVIRETSNLSVSFDKTKDKLQGAADFVANANLGWNQKFKDKKEMDFVVSYSYVGEYLYSLSSDHTGNIYQKPISLLDATLKFSLDRISISAKAKNLINPKIKREQANDNNNVTYEFRNGRDFGLSLGYNF